MRVFCRLAPGGGGGEAQEEEEVQQGPSSSSSLVAQGAALPRLYVALHPRRHPCSSPAALDGAHQCTTEEVEGRGRGGMNPATAMIGHNDSKYSTTMATAASISIGDVCSGQCVTLGCDGVYLPFTMKEMEKKKKNMGKGGAGGAGDGGDAHVGEEEATAAPPPCFISQQEEVYEQCAKPLVLEAIRGKKCALLAYGQTSTGKTHTMYGPEGGNVQLFNSVDRRGIIPRVAEDLFSYVCPPNKNNNNNNDHMSGGGGEVKFVEVSCLEVYNETVTDMVAKLVTENRSRKKLTENSKNPPMKVLYKATEKERVRRCVQKVVCSNSAQCLRVISELAELRQVGATEYNHRSTRSHLILQLDVHSSSSSSSTWRRSVNDEDEDDESQLMSRSQSRSASPPAFGVPNAPGMGSLMLVDLAGSESAKSVPPRRNVMATDIGDNGHISMTTNSSSQFHPQRQQHGNMMRRSLEMKNINTSLFALKKVVSALRKRGGDHNNNAPPKLQQQQQQQQQQQHIPVNDSVLTFLLADCLQQKQPQQPRLSSSPSSSTPRSTASTATTTTALIVCCSTRDDDVAETLATLRFAQEASKIIPSVDVTVRDKQEVFRKQRELQLWMQQEKEREEQKEEKGPAVPRTHREQATACRDNDQRKGSVGEEEEEATGENGDRGRCSTTEKAKKITSVLQLLDDGVHAADDDEAVVEEGEEEYDDALSTHQQLQHPYNIPSSCMHENIDDDDDDDDENMVVECECSPEPTSPPLHPLLAAESADQESNNNSVAVRRLEKNKEEDDEGRGSGGGEGEAAGVLPLQRREATRKQRPKEEEVVVAGEEKEEELAQVKRQAAKLVEYCAQLSAAYDELKRDYDVVCRRNGELAHQVARMKTHPTQSMMTNQHHYPQRQHEEEEDRHQTLHGKENTTDNGSGRRRRRILSSSSSSSQPLAQRDEEERNSLIVVPNDEILKCKGSHKISFAEVQPEKPQGVAPSPQKQYQSLEQIPQQQQQRQIATMMNKLKEEEGEAGHIHHQWARRRRGSSRERQVRIESPQTLIVRPAGVAADPATTTFSCTRSGHSNETPISTATARHQRHPPTQKEPSTNGDDDHQQENRKGDEVEEAVGMLSSSSSSSIHNGSSTTTSTPPRRPPPPPMLAIERISSPGDMRCC